MKNIPKYIAVVLFIFSMSIAIDAHAEYCGDAILDPGEECDWGGGNSDTLPNACRSNCKLHDCGDGVTDSNEQCDDGKQQNSNLIPNACRSDCTFANCGDGVIDTGEECDDPNDIGCNDCKRCYDPVKGLPVLDAQMAGKRIALCEGEHVIPRDDEEIIRIDAADFTLDCNGAVLKGIGTNDQKQSTAVVIAGSNVVLRDCNISKFFKGVHILSTAQNAVLLNNSICNNAEDIVTETGAIAPTYGIRNACIRPGTWNDVGATGCLRQCIEKEGTNLDMPENREELMKISPSSPPPPPAPGDSSDAQQPKVEEAKEMDSAESLQVTAPADAKAEAEESSFIKALKSLFKSEDAKTKSR